MHCKTKILGVCTLGMLLGTMSSLGTAVTPLPTWRSQVELWTMLPELHGTWPSPCYPILDVVEKTLGHERILVQVDQMWCLERQTRSHPCVPCLPRH